LISTLSRILKEGNESFAQQKNRRRRKPVVRGQALKILTKGEVGTLQVRLSENSEGEEEGEGEGEGERGGGKHGVCEARKQLSKK
jgi:hypothetical protein